MSVKSFYDCCLLLVGGVALVLPSGYSLGFYLLCLISIALWIKSRGELLPPDVELFVLPLLVYAVGHGVMALNEKWTLREVNHFLPFFIVVFGLWGIRKYKPNADWYWMGLALGAIGAAIYSAHQALVIGGRAGGALNPIQFGNIALLFGVLCMVRALVKPTFGWVTWFLWLGFLGGFAASIWSQARGGWLALVFIVIWIFIYATRQWTTFKRRLAAIVICSLMVVPVLQSDGVVKVRIIEAVAEFKAYLETDKQDSSVGARLTMWTLVFENVMQSPLLGQGDKGWIMLRDKAIGDGRLSNFSATFTHVHNEFLNVAFKRGFIGLALYLALFLVPMLLFFRPYLNHAAVEVRSSAMAGMVIPMMYVDFGLTQTFLSHNSGRVVLCSLWMCVAGLMLNAVEDNQTHDAS